MSLRDQLLKAGLVTKKQAKQTESVQKKQEHDSKKSKEIEAKLSLQKSAEILAIEEEKQKRIELDRELNRKRDQMIAQRENYHRARQLLISNHIAQKETNQYYFFAEGKHVRKIMVSSWHREMLARGKLGIGKPVEDVDEYVLIPLDCAKIIQQIYPSKLIVLHSEIQDDEEFDTEMDVI